YRRELLPCYVDLWVRARLREEVVENVPGPGQVNDLRRRSPASYLIGEECHRVADVLNGEDIAAWPADQSFFQTMDVAAERKVVVLIREVRPPVEQMPAINRNSL